MAQDKADTTHEPVEVMSDATAPEERTLVLAREIYPEELPIIPVVGRPMFPRLTAPVAIDNPEMIAVLTERAKRKLRHVGVILRKDPAPGVEPGPLPDPDEMFKVGVVAEIVQMAQPSENLIHVLVTTHERFRVSSYVSTKPVLVARVEYMLEADMSDNPELKAFSISVVQAIKSLIQLNPLHKEELGLLMQHGNLSEPGRLADIAAALTTATAAEQQEVLETVSVRDRLSKVLLLLRKEIDISRIQAKIGKQIDEKVTKNQREFFLREQLKMIKKELGLEKEGKESEVDRFQERLTSLKLTAEAQERINEEIEKLKLLEPISPEFAVTRNYLDWLTVMPWGVFTQDQLDLPRAARMLDEDHYGLQDVKERILEFLAVGILKGRIAGSILCFVGPPGVGKTSLGRSIARAVGRQFYRFSVGGMRDEAEIKGHRRTYIGAMPGKLIQVLKICKSANPVIMIDEIDKIGMSYQGDPASALLEVLDPEQNADFLDHYLDVRFDLRNVFFICTANQTDTIPRPLLDRMETINLAGYITEEKIEIARRYLIPKERSASGLRTDQIKITTPAIRHIIDGWAREAGVRSLEKQIGKIMRKSARKIVEKAPHDVRIDVADVEPMLGRPLFADDPNMTQPSIGVVTGLAWTSLGGDTLSIEAIALPGEKPGYKQTGQLGEVMVESSEIAYSYVRSLLRDDSEATKQLEHSLIHLHVPAGATKKDGPSAGITMAAALYSLVTKQRVRQRLAMTGELTLTGRVMPIGGIKEKIIAARRSGIKTLIFPAENRKDFDILPEPVRKGLDPRFVERFEEVVEICFGKHSDAKPARRK
ncbi:MAG: endopeptidase La [Kiritimatiellae bacterium]|nr:endopeptidase La [Kiritimatiellia bacterium]